MVNLKSFIESGILESYVLGNASLQDNDLVEEMARSFNEVRSEIDSIFEAMEFYALSHAVLPKPTVKPFLMATIDYTERMKSGEQPSFPPELQRESTISDYAEWLNRKDMVVPDDFGEFHAKIIGYTSAMITAVLWIKSLAPQEVHDNEYEKFLIIEGSCNILVEDKSFSFGPGDYFSIPLHKKHQVIVTSSIPCKAILQRVAA